jgi:hypothetical protein
VRFLIVGKLAYGLIDSDNLNILMEACIGGGSYIFLMLWAMLLHSVGVGFSKVFGRKKENL